MKNLLFSIMILIFAGTMFAQTTTDRVVLEAPGHVRLNVSADSAGTYWSNAFSLRDHDDLSFATYPIQYGVDAATADSISVAVYVFACFGTGLDTDNWVVADTLATISSATAAIGTKDFNNVHAPFYKLKVVNNTGYPANTGIKIGIYAYQKD